MKNIMNCMKNNYMMEKNHLIVGENDAFNLNCFETQRNNNVLICGSPGTGKTRSYLLPNLLNDNELSYVIVDVKGDLITKTAPILKEKGYIISVFNLKQLNLSEKFNPFTYCENEKDLCAVIDLLFSKEGISQKDPFWDLTSKLLLQAIFFYIYFECPKSDHNMASVLKLLRTIEVDEVNPNKKSTFDLLFERLREYKPEHIALKQYDAFKIAADKTMKSIVISAYSHLFLFNLKSVNSLTEESTIDFSNLHQRKTALYIILDDMDSSMNPIASVFLSQLFQILIRDADNSSKQRLDIPIHFFLDDFCGYQIKDFYKIIACARSRGIGISLFLQSESQLESIYGKSNSHTIINCCDTYLYLGGSDISTCENISKRTEQSLKNILEMPIGHLWIFRRGEKSRLSKIYNLNKSFYFNQIESANREFKYSDYLSSSSFKYSQNTKVKYKTKRINPEKAILGETKLFDLSTKVKIDDNIEDLNFEIKHLNKIERKELDPQTKGYLYEEEIAHVFENLGFSTEVTSKSNDYGADIIAIKNNKKYAIQVKYRNKENITVGAIQEVLGAIGYYKADQGIVVANKEFTYSAKILAKENDVILVNGDDITSIRKKLAI